MQTARPRAGARISASVHTLSTLTHLLSLKTEHYSAGETADNKQTVDEEMMGVAWLLALQACSHSTLHSSSSSSAEPHPPRSRLATSVTLRLRDGSPQNCGAATTPTTFSCPVRKSVLRCQTRQSCVDWPVS